MITFAAEVHIDRPIEDVFAYVSDPLNFPRWNSAVRAMRTKSGTQGAVGSTYSMERRLPGGRAQNELEVVARESPREFAIRTTSGPTPFVYRYSFASEGVETVLRLEAAVELEGLATLLAPLAARAVKQGVDDNFTALKTILEA